jgi:hypothetical protein
MRWVQRYSPTEPVDLSNWYCGITHNSDYSKLDEYLKSKGITDFHFRRWLSNDLIASNEILSFFIRNGMRTKPLKGKPHEATKYVYVFKYNPKILDEVLSIIS